jgi:uncharacterized delta-60 repeat protein
MKKTISLALILFTALWLVAHCLVQEIPGTLDTSFNHKDTGNGNGEGADDDVVIIAEQPDGKLIIAGKFRHYNGKEIGQIARINIDGTLDESFKQGKGLIDHFKQNSDVYDVKTQKDGKILVAGRLGEYNNTPVNNLIRLKNDGALDPNFDISKSATIESSINKKINCIAIQADGKILLGTGSTRNDDMLSHSIIRINEDGSLDSSFTTTVHEEILSLAIQPDGSIIAGGYFPNGIIGIDNNGIPRSDFNIENKNFGLTKTITLQPDGKIIIGSRQGIYRLLPDGLIDAAFERPPEKEVEIINLLPDGEILLGGDFSGRIKRLKPNGLNDPFFDPDTRLRGRLNNFLYSKGAIYLATDLTRYGKYSVMGIARILDDASFDTSFNRNSGIDGWLSNLAVQPDNKIIVYGSFRNANGEYRRNIARLEKNGNLDTGFDAKDSADGFDASRTFIALQKDGKVILPSTSVNTSKSGTCLIRLNKDGSKDPTFNPGKIGCPTLAATSEEGNIFLAGTDPTPLKLDKEGNLDESFQLIDIDKKPTKITAMAIQPDDKVIIAGNTPGHYENKLIYIARFNADGSFDTSFNPPEKKGSNQIQAITIQPDGKILLIGNFNKWLKDGKLHEIIRLNQNGEIDENFISSIYPAYKPKTHLQPDGRILVTGNIRIRKANENRDVNIGICRLNADGSTDDSFDAGKGFGGTSTDLWDSAITNDGDLIVGGQFTSYNNQGRNRIAKIHTGQYRWQWHKRDNTVPAYRLLISNLREYFTKPHATDPKTEHSSI